SQSVSDSINSLTSSEPLTISGGSLSITAASTISSTLTISGGTLAVTGDLSVSGLTTLTSGAVSGSGALNADGGMAINPADAAFLINGPTVTNAVGQTATWTGDNSNISAQNGAIFVNLGTFLAENSGDFGYGASSSGSSFINKGSFTKSTDAGTV